MSTGRVVIVTGAGSGLGFHVAKLLSSSGHDVILAGRDEEQIKTAVDSIKQVHNEATLSHLQLDVSSLESVRKFADEFHALGKKLHGLITCDGVKLNNAVRCRRYSPDNFELTMATNHLGHFLLTNLLLPDLKTAATEDGNARVVVVSSSMHDTKMSKQCKNLQPLDLDNLLLFNEKTYSSLQAYKNSRAANVMFAYELARRVQDSGIKVNAICPGVEPVEEGTGNGMHKVFAQVFKQCITAPEITHDKCAVDICSLLTEEKYKDMTGKYVVEGVDVPSSDETMNEELQSKLWELSARYVRLDGYEPLEVVPPPAEEEIVKKKDEKTNKKKNKKAKTDDDENSEDKLIVQNGHNEDEKGGEEDAQNNGTAEENGVHVDSEPANGGETVDENGAVTTVNDEVENIKNSSASTGVAEENGVENNGESKVEESPAVDIEQQEPLIQNGNDETAQ